VEILRGPIPAGAMGMLRLGDASRATGAQTAVPELMAYSPTLAWSPEHWARRRREGCSGGDRGWARRGQGGEQDRGR